MQVRTTVSDKAKTAAMKINRVRSHMIQSDYWELLPQKNLQLVTLT